MNITATDNNKYIADLLRQDPLYVFAMEVEAAEEFKDYHPLVVGIGKVNAAYQLTKRILQQKPSIIINMGSAGSHQFERGKIICCTSFLQRDMDVTGLGFRLYETPLSGDEPLLDYGLCLNGLQQGICGTGDNFETAHATDAYNVIDMEGFALAYIAKQENIPMLSLKYISDGANGSAADDWNELVHKAAVAFKRIIVQLEKM
jgi:adenosylhomocysteine nucleosidase